MARKRNAGEGSVFERADGRWCAVLSAGWEGGRRVRRYLYGKTAGEVQEQLLKARADHAQGLPVNADRQAVGQFLADWLENSARPSVRASTCRSYEQTVRNHLVPEIGRLSLRKLEPQHVRAMLNHKLAAGLSARSAAYLRVVLRAAINQARKWNLVARNAAELVEPPKCERFRIEPLSPEQARGLLEAAKADRLEALYAVALACGLRMGEVLESVRKVHEGLQSFRSMNRMEARRRKARASILRFSQSLASLRQRLSQARVRSTIQRLGCTTQPLMWPQRLMMPVARWGRIMRSAG